MSATLLTSQQPTGLIVDPGGKALKVLPIETWKKMLRLMRETKAEGFKARFVCAKCDQHVHLTVPNKTSPRLECGCTAWIGR